MVVRSGPVSKRVLDRWCGERSTHSGQSIRLPDAAVAPRTSHRRGVFGGLVAVTAGLRMGVCVQRGAQGKHSNQPAESASPHRRGNRIDRKFYFCVSHCIDSGKRFIIPSTNAQFDPWSSSMGDMLTPSKVGGSSVGPLNCASLSDSEHGCCRSGRVNGSPDRGMPFAV